MVFPAAESAQFGPWGTVGFGGCVWGGISQWVSIRNQFTPEVSREAELKSTTGKGRAGGWVTRALQGAAVDGEVSGRSPEEMAEEGTEPQISEG